jgi:N-acetyl-alpha-D-glucosaminyl L-malate synthase BshA
MTAAPDALSIGVVCWSGLGGSGVVASELALGLAERGHRVHMIATSPPGRTAASTAVEFHRITVPSYPLFEHAPYDLAAASAIVDVAGRHRLELLHVHYAVPHAASAWLARGLLGSAAPRVITSLHGTDVTRVGADPAYRPVTRFTVERSDGVVTPSEYLRRQAHERLGLSDRVHVEVIPNFVDTERFAPAPRAPREAPVLFHVSNFRPVKRTLELIDVLARVRRELPARLLAVGDGPDRAAAERRAAELGVADAVRFLGRRADFAAELAQADAFVLPSETESFGVAALEALSAGVPVFAYRVGGLPEVVPDAAGRLVEPYDVDALARAVIDVVSSPARHAAMSAAARAHALARFRREPAIERYEALFRRVLHGGLHP